MSEPFLGQITMFGGNFAPRGWAFCDGQLLSISAYSALFSILGTTYGGDGRTTFALPDLRGRASVHPGRGPGLSDYRLGQKGGAETTTLTVNELPSHNHSVEAYTKDQAGGPSKVLLAEVDASSQTSTSTQNTGGSLPFSNIQPFLCVNYIIALQGVFPSRG